MNQPPNNIDAEKAVLGVLLIKMENVHQAIQILKPCDFYVSKHQKIYKSVVSLTRKNITPDIVTIMSDLGSDCDVGYLSSLIDIIPNVSSFKSHCKIIANKAKARKFISTAQDIIARCYEDKEPIEDIANDLNSGFADATRSDETRKQTAKDIVADVLEEVKGKMDGVIDPYGVPSGFCDLDMLTCGFQKQDLIIIAGRPGMGKAQDVNCMVKAFNGWKRIGDLKIGERIASPGYGNASYVKGVYPQGVVDAYEVEFSDGTKTICNDQHLWSVRYRDWESNRVVDCGKLAEMLSKKRYENRLYIPIEISQFGSPVTGSLHPYVLGALIGDGSFVGGATPTITNKNIEVLDKIRRFLPSGCSLNHSAKTSWRIVDSGNGNRVRDLLVDLNLYNKKSIDKHIPRRFLDGSTLTRTWLARGLMDTDGCVEKTGATYFSTSSEKLKNDSVELFRSLGFYVSVSERVGKYRKNGELHICQNAFRVYISGKNTKRLFTVESKKTRTIDNPRVKRKNFKSIRYIGKREMVCISVTHPSKLYFTDDYILTHNTSIAMNMITNAAKKGFHVLVFSQEMSRKQLIKKEISAGSGVNYRSINMGMLNSDTYARVHKASQYIAKLPITIDDSSALHINKITSRSKHEAIKNKVDLIVIDYLGLSRGDSDNRTQEVGQISGGLKALAKDLDIPVIALSQLNRGLESRPDKRPMMSDLRDSGAIEQDASVICFLYRDEYYNKAPDNPLKGITELNVAKNREGDCGKVELTFDGATSSFCSLSKHDQ